ncbi:sigma-54 interaction domain-containing protein [Agarilytica rhodophyticola]|uniref:sigma-54 interaction domain-containing protein n=1 Tax=Agarilytica rhodophyticola TaxID=1737490 RepID=UPI001C2001F0|nr:sigma-54-dependent Fis family transcriptional regulator [Agarilytica rhodophyticola]
MKLIASDRATSPLRSMLEGYDCPAILVSVDYQILATNNLYRDAFGEIELNHKPRCFEVSHGYKVPCDQAGEDCPLSAARASGHRERVLHIHQTPRGREHVNVEMLPIFDENNRLSFFVELLRAVPLASAKDSEKKLVGMSEAFNHMLSKIARVGVTETSVLLLGESGTGKELAAQAIHMASVRKDKPLVTLECAGLTESLFESELFGHVRGAFTGAHNSKQGLAELANGGTLFLDEIGDVPLSIQVKLLRLLESGSYRPVGSAEVKRADFRLICATHKNILNMVKEGSFRQDLYYRINVFPIRTPSLAERQEDIPLLVKTLIHQISPNKEYYVTDSAMKVLRQHHYVGNIRELRNILNRAIVLADTNMLEENIITESISADFHPVVSIEDEVDSFNELVDLKTAEKNYLSKLMAKFSGDKEKVSTIAGISIRSLYRKLEE